MDFYLDEIRGYAHKLEAVGYHIEDDLVFCAIKGLPSKFKHVKSALTARGDVLFDELVTILRHRDGPMRGHAPPLKIKIFLHKLA